MVLTNCAACGAAPLAHNPPRCRECESTFCKDATFDNLREAVTTLEETLRTARRVLGGEHPMTESIVVRGLQTALSHLHDAVDALAETERTARRLLGSAHPVTAGIEVELRDARAALVASETPSPRSA